MADFLVSRAGRPLHLSILAYDRDEYQRDPWPTCRYVPLCGQDRGRRWLPTGPWAERWEVHRRGGMCSRCLTVLASFDEAAGAVGRD